MSNFAAPVDATTTPAWATLQAHHDEMVSSGFSLKEAFAADPERVSKLSFDMDDLHTQRSTVLVDKKTLGLLCDLARAVGLEERRDAMYAGEHINTTEDRAVLHTALRRPASEKGTVFDGDQDCVADVHEVLDRMYAFAECVRSGEWKGVHGQAHRARDVHRHRRLRPRSRHGLRGPQALRRRRHRLPLRLQHRPQRHGREGQGARPRDHARDRGLQDLHHARDPHQRPARPRPGCSRPCARRARSTGPRSRTPRRFASTSWPSPPTSSSWPSLASTPRTPSASGTGSAAATPSTPPWALSLIVAFGPERFECFLKGFHDLDEYFQKTPLEQNVVALLGLLNVWYVNFWGAESHAVLPYNQYLHRFAAYLQQLTMESNGKGVRWDGSPVTSATGEIFWGEPGHQRPARLLPAHPPGHPHDSRGLHRLREHAQPHA